MSKFIFVYHKKEKNLSNEIEKICENIRPDNLETPKPFVSSDNNGITFGIYNPSEVNKIKNNSVCLGYINTVEWYKIGNDELDGNFALVRSDSETIELVSDVVASRTLWYFSNEDFFAVATSQRMLISYLGSFELNEQAISWMLATGSLGYGFSWDKRIKCLPSDSKLVFNRKTWESKIIENPVIFKPKKEMRSISKTKLKNVLSNSIKKIDIDFKKWALPLSGGYDSRGILLNIKKSIHLNTITWGLESSINDPGSDAYVAKQISKNLSLKHNYYHTNFSDESIKNIFDRFLKIGEGRTDNIGGYLDGFEIWKKLYYEGFLGVIRGDEGFGWLSVRNEDDSIKKNGIFFLHEYNNLKPYLKDLPANNLPKKLLRNKSENIEVYRDRLYHQFRIPTVLAALNDLKLSHVEVINPLLSKEIILTVRELPDGLRTDKKLFKEIVQSYDLNVPYAKHSSNMEINSIFKQKKVVEEIKSVILYSSILNQNFLNYVNDNMNINKGRVNFSAKEKLKRSIKSNMPSVIKELLRKNIPTNIDVNLLAFRIYMITRMDEILIEDAKLLQE